MLYIKSEEISFKEIPGGEFISVLVGRHKSCGEAKQQTVAMVLVKQGKSSDAHFHKEREESYFILQGQGVAKINESEFPIKAGDLVFASAGEIHQFKNCGVGDLKYIVFTAPSWVPEDSHLPN